MLKGFLLRVQPSGIISYICEYARGKRETIGRVGVISAIQANFSAGVDLLTGVHPMWEGGPCCCPRYSINAIGSKALSTGRRGLYGIWAGRA
jgi:hypothetical protein